MRSPSRWSDQHVEQLMGRLLQTGVIISALIVAVGGAGYLANHGADPIDHRAFQGEPSRFTTVTGIITHAANLHARGLIQFGLLLLIATPIARVAFSAIAFVRQRDKTYTVLTLIVLAVLTLSLLGGAGEGGR